MEKIANKLIRILKPKEFNKIINLADVRTSNEKISEINAGLKKRLGGHDFDPSHKVYALAQNLLSHFSEEVSVLKEFTIFYNMWQKADHEYMPSGPPMSPLTASYFTYWIMLDFRFGHSKETIGTIFYDVGMERKIDETILKATQNLNESSMAFYQHLGFADDMMVLKDIITNQVYNCICPSGYKGKKDEIWFVRLVPNLDEVYAYYITMNTPYIIVNYSENDWLSFFRRQGIKTEDEGYQYKSYGFLKYHPDHNYWHNYIMDAYSNYTSGCIYLTGIPDIKGSKPHEMNF